MKLLLKNYETITKEVFTIKKIYPPFNPKAAEIPGGPTIIPKKIKKEETKPKEEETKPKEEEIKPQRKTKGGKTKRNK